MGGGGINVSDLKFVFYNSRQSTIHQAARRNDQLLVFFAVIVTNLLTWYID